MSCCQVRGGPLEITGEGGGGGGGGDNFQNKIPVKENCQKKKISAGSSPSKKKIPASKLNQSTISKHNVQ